MDNPETYEAEVLDNDDIENIDVKINPDYYIHIAIVKAINALSNPDMKSGFLQYFVIVENVEIMAEASGMLSDEYHKAMKEFNEKFQSGPDQLVNNVKIAQEKFKHILKNIFKLKTLTGPMRLGDNVTIKQL